MRTHWEEFHQGNRTEFKFKILRQCRSSFEQELSEAILIKTARDGHLLNNKEEFNRCIIPELTMRKGNKVVDDVEEEKKEQDVRRSRKRSPETEDLHKEQNPGIHRIENKLQGHEIEDLHKEQNSKIPRIEDLQQEQIDVDDDRVKVDGDLQREHTREISMPIIDKVTNSKPLDHETDSNKGLNHDQTGLSIA